jgi:catechol 2,3-dioxygenase-like lactoylglutathione lyase family enzyme
MTATDQFASVRYIVSDVQAAVDFYTTHLGFTLNTSAAPAFADIVWGDYGCCCPDPPAPAPAPPPRRRHCGPQPHPPRAGDLGVQIVDLRPVGRDRAGQGERAANVLMVDESVGERDLAEACGQPARL